MTDFDFWEMAYRYEWATKDDLKKAVELGDITTDEYQQITNEDYVVA
ncbi:XkdX family protein [Bacillus subtilis]|uniref:XkdX family protein n=1 Tax=Bacillus subtilis subsp. subtilis TaxID=135461 RepID=A0ABD3ZUP8_BACIU|nr:XkdX family protein [Bacillus subtilis]KIL31997.1 hypothetical protein B4067_2270 [Bacillus subtilis subsp. subtilis]KIN58113.1 hypothetical protein B4145_2185 [Bacillus subtilis]